MGCGLCDRGRHGDGNVFYRREWLEMDSKHVGMDGVKSHLHAVSSDPLFSGFAVDVLKESKKKKKRKSARGYNFTPMPTLPPFAAANVCCMWSRTVDVMKHA